MEEDDLIIDTVAIDTDGICACDAEPLEFLPTAISAVIIIGIIILVSFIILRHCGISKKEQWIILGIELLILSLIGSFFVHILTTQASG